MKNDKAKNKTLLPRYVPHQNIKIQYFLKDILKIGQKKFLSFAKLKTQFRGLMLLVT